MSSKQQLVNRTNLLNKLRELGFHFFKAGAKVELWRRPTDFQIAEVPLRKKKVPVTYVRFLLGHCKCSPEEIESFLKDC